MRKGGKTARNYEDEEWRTVYIGFVERGTSSEDLAKVFKVSYINTFKVILLCYFVNSCILGFGRDRETDSKRRICLHSLQRRILGFSCL